MLDAKQLSGLSGQLTRRRLNVAREVKEASGMVVDAFEQAKQQYGAFHFNYVKVMEGGGNSPGHNIGSGGSGIGSDVSGIVGNRSTTTKETKEIRKVVEIPQPDGSTLSIEVDRERFYCTEVLFDTSLLPSKQDEQSIVQTIIASVDAIDDSVRQEVCQKVILCGKTCLLPGFTQRLRRDIEEGLSFLDVTTFEVVLAEDVVDADVRSAAASVSKSAVWKGAELRMKHVHDVPFETQNFVTAGDYADMGQSVLSNLLIG